MPDVALETIVIRVHGIPGMIAYPEPVPVARPPDPWRARDDVFDAAFAAQRSRAAACWSALWFYSVKLVENNSRLVLPRQALRWELVHRDGEVSQVVSRRWFNGNKM